MDFISSPLYLDINNNKSLKNREQESLHYAFMQQFFILIIINFTYLPGV